MQTFTDSASWLQHCSYRSSLPFTSYTAEFNVYFCNSSSQWWHQLSVLSLSSIMWTIIKTWKGLIFIKSPEETVEWQSPRNLSNRSIHITWLFSEMSFRMHFGSISDTFPNFIRNASQMHQKCIINLSQIQIKTQYFFKISLPYTLKLIKYQVSIVKSKFMEINLSKTLQNCCKWLH